MTDIEARKAAALADLKYFEKFMATVPPDGYVMADFFKASSLKTIESLLQPTHPESGEGERDEFSPAVEKAMAYTMTLFHLQDAGIDHERAKTLAKKLRKAGLHITEFVTPATPQDTPAQGDVEEAMTRIGRNCPSYGAFECGYQSETDFKTVKKFIDNAIGRNEVVEVTVDELLTETNNPEYLPMEGYKGSHADAKYNQKNLVHWIAKKYAGKAIRIVEER